MINSLKKQILKMYNSGMIVMYGHKMQIPREETQACWHLGLRQHQPCLLIHLCI